MKRLYRQMIAITLFVVLAILIPSMLNSWMNPTYAQAPGYTRYVVVDSGISVISGNGTNYYVSNGYIDLPTGAEWITPLMARGIIQPLYTSWQLNGSLRALPMTPIAVSNNSIITTTGVYQPLTATVACGTSSIAAAAAGTMVVFENLSNNTITLTDTETLLLSGNAALGQYDTLSLISDGTNWIQVSKSDN